MKPTAPPSTPVQLPTATKSGDDLIAIIEVSDPQSSTYNPQSNVYAEFPEALKQLSRMDPSKSDVDVAGELAHAISFPRQDSYLAAPALISLGSDWAATTLPILIDNLKNQKPTVRMASAFVLSFIGKQASCAVGNISPLLWDADAYVRSTAALALESITGEDLVPNAFKITPDYQLITSVIADSPEGKIVAGAREWWTDQGSKVNWHPSYDLCDP